MIVTIHQPNYFPYPGFFQKVLLSDVCVILDRAQFEFDITNRNKIITPEGSWTRISVPIKKGQKFFEIKNVEIDNEQTWAEKNWNLIFDLNFYTLKKVFEWLDIKTKIILDSELDVTGRSSDHLLNICKKMGASKYLSGPGGRNYLNEKIFKQSKIEVEYQIYDPIIYSQKYAKPFIPNLSILDLLFNVGSDSKKLIRKSGE